jgi:ribonuclease-3
VTLKDLFGFSKRQSPVYEYFKKRFQLKVKNLELFEQAFTHKSYSNKNPQYAHNEKLEFLGDAILGAVFSSYLHQAFPNEDEGMLTKMRARVVNRQNLTLMAVSLDMDKFIKAEKNLLDQKNNSLPGNTLEAVTGALYLERGYAFTRKFILRHLLPLIEEHKLLESDNNHKSKLLEWAHKFGKEVHIESEETKAKAESRRFKAIVQIDGKVYPAGYGRKKKYAEQDAALGALIALGEL